MHTPFTVSTWRLLTEEHNNPAELKIPDSYHCFTGTAASDGFSFTLFLGGMADSLI